MGSIKCQNCGLVQFSTGGACKRCKKDVGVAAGFKSSHTPTRSGGRGFRFQSTYPLVAWLITLLLLFSSSTLAYVVARESTTDVAEVVGATVGGAIAWPLVLLIVYALSRKFREKYSMHAVINYGLGLNSIILAFMSAR